MKINDHQYADEFLEELTLLEFSSWIVDNLKGMVINISYPKISDKKPLHEWISWFLDWSEYSDFIEWKKACEKNG